MGSCFAVPNNYFSLQLIIMSVPSPCNKVCETNGEICLSCGRTLEEVCNWMSMSDAQKLHVLKRLGIDPKNLE